MKRNELLESRSLIIIDLSDCSKDDEERVQSDIARFILKRLRYVNHGLACSAKSDDIQTHKYCLNTYHKTILV